MATIGVFAFIVDESRRVLCVKLNYAGGGWTTPGGRVEPGESPTDALRREAEEETGYIIEIGELIGTYAKPYQDDIVLSFDARIVGRSAWLPTAEIAEVRFFPEHELPGEIGAVARKRIEDGFLRRRGIFRELSQVGDDAFLISNTSQANKDFSN